MSIPSLFTWSHASKHKYNLGGLRRPSNYLYNVVVINGEDVYFPFCLAYVNGKKSQQVKSSLVVA